LCAISGLEPKGLVAKAPAKFTVETFGAGDGEVQVEVFGPDQKPIKCDVIFNNDRKQTYSCSYFPEEEGDYVVTIRNRFDEAPFRQKSCRANLHPILTNRAIFT
jgi:filamin